MDFPEEFFPARPSWESELREGWRAHFDRSGEIDWSLYPKTPTLPPLNGAGVDLRTSRLLLISSSGAYDPSRHAAFRASDPLGDYEVREHRWEDGLAGLDFAHDHYDQSAVREDPGVLLPLELLQEGVEEGRIGSVAEIWLSFMGYQPDLGCVADETLPELIAAAKGAGADAAFLVPS